MWTKKYRPNKISDFIGNEDSVSELLSWAKNWDLDDPAVILYGPPGVGKTTITHLIADRMNWDLVEMNASDKRTKSLINEIAGESSKTAPITGEDKKLTVLEEADNIHGNADRGGKTAIRSVVNDSEQPIILIANDLYELPRSLRNNVKTLEFDYLDEKELAKKLRKICREENIEFTAEGLVKLAEKSNGDVRSAINDLERIDSKEGKVSPDFVVSGQRDRSEDIFPFLDKILKTGGPVQVRNKSENLDMTPSDLYRWVIRNIYYEYDGEDFNKGISSLTKASLWLGRVRKTQNYKFWKYANDRITAGVANSRSGAMSGWTRWQPPRYGSSNNIDDDIVRNISRKSNVSLEVTRTEIMPHLTSMIEYCKPEELTAELSSEYDWNKDDISEVTKSGSDTNKVSRVSTMAEELSSDFDVKQNKPNKEEIQTENKESEEKQDQKDIDDFI